MFHLKQTNVKVSIYFNNNYVYLLRVLLVKITALLVIYRILIA